MNYFHADSSEGVHTRSPTALPNIIPLSAHLFIFFWRVEMTGAREEGKGGDWRKGKVMERGDGGLYMEGRR